MKHKIEAVAKDKIKNVMLPNQLNMIQYECEYSGDNIELESKDNLFWVIYKQGYQYTTVTL